MFFFVYTGSCVVMTCVAIVMFVLILEEFWTELVANNIGLILSYAAYYAFLKLGMEPFMNKTVTNGDYVNYGYEPMWRFCSFVLECLYIPLAVLYALTTVCINIALVLVAFVRPDIAVFPRGFESLQSGHAIFVANCKAYVYRIRQMYMGYPLKDSEEVDVILSEIDKLNAKKLE